MRSPIADEDSRLLLWRRVREFAVPPSMIKSATARRAAGDWAAACAAARVDVDLNVRAVARSRGQELAARIRADLRRLAPDLLRWHMPRIAPDGLLRPGLTISLARYQPAEPDGRGAVHLVARTPPAWADAGQRISLALWDESRPGDGARGHPHPHPHQRFRLDLHRHLWDAHRVGELAERCGAAQWAAAGNPPVDRECGHLVPRDGGYAVHRWAAEAALLLRAEGRAGDPVTVRLGSRLRLLLRPGTGNDPDAWPALRISTVPQRSRVPAWPVLPDAATWVLPDLELLRAGLIDPDRLHPLVASVLVPGHSASAPGASADAGGPRLVECRGAQHRIGLVDGVLVPLDHDPAEVRREELLAALGGPALPCLHAIDQAHRHPENLPDVRAHLDHGDAARALAAVEGLLGPDALLRSGALLDELETAALRRITHGLFRAGLVGHKPFPPAPPRRRGAVRAHPRHATR
jgi:hypothetical protein